ncbi:MAG TPA: MFS transporter [Bacteroidales bacterium]|nr:MFS transporter [Bacteroidales bacterium]
MNREQRTVLVISAIGAFLTPFLLSSVNIALPAIARDLKMNAMAMSWIPSSFLLSAAVFLLPSGKLADIAGRKRIFLLGIIIFTLATAVAGMSVNAVMLIVSRIMQGIGSTMVAATGTAIITSVFPAGKRGRALGLNVSGVYLGLSAGPFIGGFLTEHFGWRSIFWAGIPVGLTVIFLVLIYLRSEWKSDLAATFDWTGSMLYAISLVLIMTGLPKLREGWGFAVVTAGMFLGAVFLFYEKKARSPLIDTGLLFRNRTFAFSNLAALINYSATSAIVFLLSLYLQYIKHFGPRESGLIILTQPVLMALLSPLSGRLSDHIDPRIVASAGMALCTAGLFILAGIQTDTNVSWLLIALVILGIGFALFSSPNTNAIMGSVSREFLGVASAMVGTMRLTGQMMSMGIAMLVLSVFIGKNQINPSNQEAFLHASRVLFLSFSGLSLLGVFASLARGKKAKSAD